MGCWLLRVERRRTLGSRELCARFARCSHSRECVRVRLAFPLRTPSPFFPPPPRPPPPPFPPSTPWSQAPTPQPGVRGAADAKSLTAATATSDLSESRGGPRRLLGLPASLAWA